MFTTLRSKIIVGFAIVIAINVIFAMWAIYRFSLVGQELDDSVARYLRGTEQALVLSRIADEQFAEIVAGANNPDRTDSTRMRSLERRFRRTIATLPSDTSTERSSLTDSIRASYDRFLGGSSEIQDPTADTQRLLSDVTEEFSNLSALIAALAAPESGSVSVIRGELTEELQEAFLLVGIGTLIATILALVGGSLYARWALQSIERLQQAVRGVTGGELTTKIHITSADELGDLSFEFNRMVERLRHFEEMNLESLLLERRRAETIVQSISIPIIVVSDQMTVAMANAAALRLFQRRLDSHVADLPLSELLAHQPLIEAFAAAHSSREPADQLMYVREVEGEEQFFSVQILSLDGASAGVVGVFTDVTQYKKLDRLKSDLLARISHEFRTPLSSIIMTADLFSREMVGEVTTEQRDLLADLKADAIRLSTLIESLLEASRLQSDEERTERSRILLKDFLDETLKPLRMVARRKDVTIALEMRRAPTEIVMNEEHLRWIINNLVSNAIRHSPEQEVVAVELYRDQELLVLEVSDQGPGIPLESQHMIFDRFFQVDAGDASSPGSVGLGLAIVRDVLRTYDGRVEVQSRLGEGARFVVSIPIQEVGLNE